MFSLILDVALVWVILCSIGVAVGTVYLNTGSEMSKRIFCAVDYASDVLFYTMVILCIFNLISSFVKNL